MKKKMHLKIAAPDKTIFAGEIHKITVPTEEGEITILPQHQPLTGVVKPGMLSLVPAELPEEHDYIMDGDSILLTVSKGVVFVDGEHIIITTSAATTSPAESAEVLQQMQQDMEATLEKIKVE
jgi:F-type H+-transporting ATPase subunit epsilon